MISLRLWYVPMIVPKNPNKIMNEFLINICFPGPFGFSDFTIISRRAGIIKAKAVEHIDPISEMKSPNLGTASAIPTKIKT